jgi:hypothetical protein
VLNLELDDDLRREGVYREVVNRYARPKLFFFFFLRVFFFIL